MSLGNQDLHTVVEESRDKRHRVGTVELENGFIIGVLESSLPLLIGRGADCDICIPTSHVSRHHCELFLQNGALCLRDVSTNGTMVGAHYIQQEAVSLKRKTTVCFAGETTITVRVAGSNIAHDEPGRSATDRRQGERRHGERRQKIGSVVTERRMANRRKGP
jgi:predicted component of type VI protein secretion system